MVIWLWSHRITSHRMENAKNSFKIDIIRHVNLPFIQEEMTLWWISDETLTTGKDWQQCKDGLSYWWPRLIETIVKVRRRDIWYRTTEGVKRQPVMTHVAQISKTFMNNKKNAIELVFKVLSSKQTLPAISKLHFEVGVECRKSDVKSVMP